MRMLAWLKNQFRGRAAADRTPAHDELGPAFEERCVRIRDLFAEIDAHLRSNRSAEAEAACQQLTMFLTEWPTNETRAESREILAGTLFDLGSFYRILRKRDEAERAYDQALSIWQELSSAQPEDAQLLGRMAGCKNHLGLLYQATDALEQAAGFFQEAMSLRERLLASHPQDEENLVYLGGTLCNLGNVAADQNEFQTALAWYHKAIDILDQSVPGCECGCRDLHANMHAFVTGRPSPVLIAQQFLRNALQGRAALLAKENPDSRFRHVRSSERGDCTVVSILTEQIVGSREGSSAQMETLQELKRELLDAVSFAPGPVILDLQAVRAMDAEGVALLLHLRGRLVGGGEWPSLCGLSPELRAAVPSVPWDDDFKCYPSVDEALADLDD